MWQDDQCPGFQEPSRDTVGACQSCTERRVVSAVLTQASTPTGTLLSSRDRDRTRKHVAGVLATHERRGNQQGHMACSGSALAGSFQGQAGQASPSTIINHLCPCRYPGLERRGASGPARALSPHSNITIPSQTLSLGHPATTHPFTFRDRAGYLLGPRDGTLELAAAFTFQGLLGPTAPGLCSSSGKWSIVPLPLDHPGR